MTFIDRLERRFGWIAVPGVVKIIVAFQALIWLLNIFRENDLAFHLLLFLDKDLILSGQVWRVISFILIPPVAANQPIFMLFAVIFTIFLGNMLEQIWGSFRLTLYLLGGIIGVVIAEFAIGFSNNVNPTYLIIESILFACAVYNPNYTIHLFGVIPIRLFWIALFGSALLFIDAVQSLTAAGLILISLMNFFVVFVPGMKKTIQVKAQVATRRNQFEKAKMSQNETLHLCASCGKTEQDDDELIFRVSASGEEYCEECRGMDSGVVNNEVSETPRIYERASKKPRPAQRKKNKERWSYDQENSE